MKLVDLIKNNVVEFDSYRQGFFYYNIKENAGWGEPQKVYQFPVPLHDIGNATLLKKDKAITYMRWIRKAQEDGTFTKILNS